MVVEYETIKVEYSNNVGIISLNRPEKLNPIGLVMARELIKACDEVEQSGKARAVIFTGAGRAFSAGGDLEDMMKTITLKPAEQEPALRLWDMVTLRVRGMELSTIAAVNGLALGAGCALAIACDIRIASEDARIGAIFVRRGASAADMGVSWILPRLVGAGWAAELMLTGDIIDAVQAEHIGLFNRVVPADQLMEAAQALAARLATGPPLGLKITKRALYQSLWYGLSAQLEYEDLAQTLCFLTEDFQEGIKSFFEKREPEFRGY